jgi:hypothetical protein
MRLLQISAKRWGILVFAGLALALLSSSAASAPAPARTGSAKLTFRLAALASSDLRNAPRAAQAVALSLPARGPGSLLRVNGNPLVQIRADSTSAATRQALEAAGARIVNISAKYHTFTASVPVAALQRIAGIAGVQAVTDVLTPMTASWGSGAGISAINSTCPQGVKVSEGDVQLRANLARSAYGVNGAGVKVGILSDSFNTWAAAPTHAATDSASGDLPGAGNTCGFTTPVQLIDDSVLGEDEGRGMAQIVHDLAPGAALAFASAFTGELGFAANILALKAAGAKVIVDDVTYFDEPFFQDGPVAAAVNTVTGAGATYFSSAANNNILSGGNAIGSFETPAFHDSGSCPAGAPLYATHCEGFNGSTDNTYGITVPNGRTLRVDIQWAQPWFGVTTDNDAYLTSSGGVLLAKSEYFNVSTSKTPFEFIGWTNSTGTAQNVNLSINRYSGVGGGDTATPRLKLIFVENGAQDVVPTEYTSSTGGNTVGPSIFGHNGGANTMSTAAVPYNNSAAPESYSSRGPLSLYYSPVNGIVPAPILGAAQVLNKPDIAATDGGANTFFGSFSGGVWRFYGTSAAAPHAAAVAALELQAKPTATVAQVKNAQTSTARAIGAFTHPAVGAGLLDAKAAVGKLSTCKVPNVIGKGLAAAKTAITKVHCAVGRISYSKNKRKKGKVLSQSPAAGRTVAGGTKVNLTVGK